MILFFNIDYISFEYFCDYLFSGIKYYQIIEYKYI